MTRPCHPRLQCDQRFVILMGRTVCLHEVPIPLAVSVLCRQSTLTTQRNLIFNVDPGYRPTTQSSPSCVAWKVPHRKAVFASSISLYTARLNRDRVSSFKSRFAVPWMMVKGTGKG